MHRVPTEAEKRILLDNGMDPDSYAIVQRSEEHIHLLCYRSRDDVMIYRGDREWPKEPEGKGE